jgi:hypothetical protein
MNIMTDDQLKKQVPSIFCTQAHEKTSSKYALISTIDCVKGLENNGFYPVQAFESRVRDKNNKPFAKHMIRFRHHSMVEKGGNLPEIVMVNSHNGTTSYQLRAGIYRLVCGNGLIVGNDFFYRKIKHQGDVITKLVDSANEIIEIVPQVLEISEKWKGIELNVSQAKEYAESAAAIKWKEDELEFSPHMLLNCRRSADSGTNLWTAFNVIQENLVRGGIRYRHHETRRRGSTRAVNSVSEICRINSELWNLTEKMQLQLN